METSTLHAQDTTLTDRILVVDGGSKHAQLNENFRHRVIRPSKHQLSGMILHSYHDMAHLGIN